jgi:uncharacterized repeat protein (TIGR01451 family)
MKNITFLIFSIFCCFVGYAQFPQNFEDASVTVPDGFPAGWLVTDNGVGSSTNWTIQNNASVVINGTKSAYINRQEIGQGNTSEDWLISPATLVPANGELRFMTKQTITGDNGTIYQIRISTGTSQNNLASYIVLQQWTENQLNPIFNIAAEKIVDFPVSTIGSNVYIAFVRVYTQPTGSLGGDRWIIDDINVKSKCLTPTNLIVNNIAATTATLGWASLIGSNGYEVELLPSNMTPTGVPTSSSLTNSVLATGLSPNTCYKFYVRSMCGVGNSSAWVGPYNFCTYKIGASCADPIVISNLPFQTSDNTINFGNTLNGPQLSSCIPGTINYQSGNDVFYSYTATATTSVSFTLNSTQTRSSMFIYPSCAGTTGACLAAIGNTTNSPRILNYAVTQGSSYIIMISSSFPTSTIAYNLLIQEEACANKPTNLLVSNTTQTGANLTWTAPLGTVLGYQIAVQPQGSPIPSGSGQYTSVNPGLVVNDLTSGTAYQYWVRSECASGEFSAWAGPFIFNTQLCGVVDQCTYIFRMTDIANNGWNGARMQIRQNGAVLQTIGSTYNAGAGPVDVPVTLCYDLPFDIFWSVAGTQPQQCIVSVVNSFGQTVATINGDSSTVNSVIYSSIVDCEVPLCNVAPTNVSVNAITFNGATINWNAAGTENVGYDIYIVAAGAPQPTASTTPSYSGMNGSSAPFLFNIPTPNSLLADTFYDVYVRVQCDPEDSPWSVAYTFKTEISCPQPANQTVSSIELNSAELGWTEVASATQWEVLLLAAPNGMEPQFPLSNPILGPNDFLFTNLTTASTTISTLQSATMYHFYVRSVCQSENDKSLWTGPFIFSTNTCIIPSEVAVSQTTMTSANLTWVEGLPSHNAWEILVMPLTSAGAPATLPEANPVLENGAYILPVTGNPSTVLTNLTAATNYICYVRTVCTNTAKSDWTASQLFSTLVCSTSETCTYKFLLSNTTNNNWNGGRIQVRQNGVVVATLGTGGVNNPNGISVQICNNAPFDLYWSEAGALPQEIGVAIINPFQDIIYTKLPGQGTPLSVLFADTTLENCTPPTCPKPTNLLVNTVSPASALLSWTEAGSASQWEVYVTEEGAAAPVNGAPLMTGVNNYYLANANTNFSITGLTPSTKYLYYVRAICSASDISTWTILNPATFITKPLNDECANAISVPVNPTPEILQTVSGNTLGGTASAEISTCPGSENDDVWFSFVATNAFHIIKLNNIVGTTTAIRFAVYSGADCSTMTQLFCSATNVNTGVLNNFVIGQMYKIRVYTNGNNVNQSATFDLSISTPLPVPNDECVNAIPLLINTGIDCAQTVTASLTGATASSQTSTCPGAEDDDIWYSFVATSPSHVITFQNIVGTATALNSSLHSGDCESLTFISCNSTNQTVLQNLIIGTTYKLRVWSNSLFAEDIQFTICLGTVAPPIIASTTQYTVPQLVNEVLINNPCSTIANITWSTGTTDATNGIGYFNKGLSGFPFEQGIILSTGNAAAVVGPNTTILSGGGAGGDADLSAILAAQTPPVTGTLNNATKLEFDFVAVTDQINFNFLFASEEYGTFQCGFSDAFAFILTNLTTGTPPVNLAVLPGTNVPVTIFNIRDSQYNTSCPSSNLAYFGNYYANPTGVLAAPINFNGITVPMTAGATVIPGNSYHIKMVIADYNDTAYDSAVFLQGGSFNPGEENCLDRIKLVAFHDTNNNGIKEESEANFTYGAFQYLLNDEGAIHNLSSPIGTSLVFDQNPTNSYDFTFNVHPEYATYFSAGTTSYNNISIAVGSGTQTLYFPISQTQGYNDVTVSLIPVGQPVAGFTYLNKVVYQNLGTAVTSGMITYTKDDAVTVSVAESGVAMTPTGFTYNFANLAPFETRSFDIALDVPSIPVTNIGDILSSSVQISAPINDINTDNNTFGILQTVVASYDPNDKMEAHGEKLDFNTFTQNDYLFYTIRFQNTGTTNAINIRIEDVLDAQLDEESLRMVSASHYYQLERVGNQLVWKFPGINLPSLIQDEALSNGYLTFKIKVKPGFQVGDIIPNFAEIYFDTNPPIITNTFMSEFEISLNTKLFSINNILLYPNPTKSLLNVSLKDTNESLAKITIYDMIGKTIQTVSGNSLQQIAINVGNLSTGVYMIEITTDSNLKQTRKFIVE